MLGLNVQLGAVHTSQNYFQVKQVKHQMKDSDPPCDRGMLAIVASPRDTGCMFCIPKVIENLYWMTTSWFEHMSSYITKTHVSKILGISSLRLFSSEACFY